MVEMKSQQKEAGKINIIVSRDLKKIVRQSIKVFRITCNQPKLDKVEIEEMQDKKCENRSSCPDHKL
jgi:hypothetical protein